MMSTSDLSPEEDESTPITFSSIIDDAEILARLDKLGFHTPTDVQRLAVPPAMAGNDVVAQAQTGSGKTLAFSLPLLKRLYESSPSKKDTFALLIAPTRELALQIQQVITSLDDEIAPVLVIGGADEQKQRKALERDARVVVGTPGRLLDMIKRKVVKLRTCRYFVLDEADEMLSMGFIEDVRAILAKLPNKRQGMFVSATITPRVDMLANSFLSKAQQINVADFKEDKAPIEHLYCEVTGDLMAKPSALCDIIETQRPRSAIIFCNTKSDTQLVEVLLRRRGFDARRINSDLTQSQREKVIKKIRAEDLQLLVATDIAARGLDIEQIDLVVNYAIHDQPESYVHRTGRTGRAGRAGRAISLVGPRDFGAFHYLQKVVDFDFNKLELPTDEEVAAARLAHLYEILRTQEIEVDERLTMVAQKLVRDNSDIENPPEELSAAIGMLCGFATEHFVNQESKSLDEELEAAPPSNEKGDRRRKDRGKDRGKDRPRERDRDRDRNQKAEGKEREPRKREAKTEGRERKPREKRTARKDSDKDSDSRGRDRSAGRNRKKDSRDRIRLYIGQGSEHGLDAETFTKLATERADIEGKDLQRITIRKHYGYVDAFREQATAMLETMADIEHNGHKLPLEVATVFEYKAPRNARNNRRNHSNSRRED